MSTFTLLCVFVSYEPFKEDKVLPSETTLTSVKTLSSETTKDVSEEPETIEEARATEIDPTVAAKYRELIEKISHQRQSTIVTKNYNLETNQTGYTDEEQENETGRPDHSGGEQKPRAFTKLVHSIIYNELGDLLAAAVYDVFYIDKAVAYEVTDELLRTESVSRIKSRRRTNPRTGVSTHHFHLTELDPWNGTEYYGGPRLPKVFLSRKKPNDLNAGLVILALKQCTSLALGSLARDGRLADDYDAFLSLKMSVDLYKRPVAAYVRGVVSHFITVLQLLADGVIGRKPGCIKHIGTADPLLVYAAALDMGAPLSNLRRDPLAGVMDLAESLRQLAGGDTGGSPHQIMDKAEALWEQRCSFFSNKNVISTIAALPPTPVNALGLTPVVYGGIYNHVDARGRENVGARDGRFWASFRPVLGCSSVTKSCDDPDGCRYMCNMNYLMAADGWPSRHGKSNSSYPHQLVGFGSNNEYDWEVGLVTAFTRLTSEQARDDTRPNTVGLITIFDCTLKRWTPPTLLLNSPFGFGYSSLCLGPTTHIQRKIISINDLKALIVQPKVRGALITRNKTSDIIRRYIGGDSVEKTTRPYPNYAVFDEVSILKVDIEGFEHNTFTDWPAVELRDRALHRLRQHVKTGHDVTDIINVMKPFLFPAPLYADVDAPHMHTTSNLLMEIHRPGHGHKKGGTLESALRLHYPMMQMYAKGFAMFAQERNPFSVCCFEIAMPHFRHYIRSEVWNSMI